MAYRIHLSSRRSPLRNLAPITPATTSSAKCQLPRRVTTAVTEQASWRRSPSEVLSEAPRANGDGVPLSVLPAAVPGGGTVSCRLEVGLFHLVSAGRHGAPRRRPPRLVSTKSPPQVGCSQRLMTPSTSPSSVATASTATMARAARTGSVSRSRHCARTSPESAPARCPRPPSHWSRRPRPRAHARRPSRPSSSPPTRASSSPPSGSASPHSSPTRRQRRCGSPVSSASSSL